MNTRNDARYPRFSIALHWLMLVLLVAVYALMELRGVFPKGSDGRELMKTWHFMLGLTVPALLLARLAARFGFRAPAITPVPPAWQHLLAVSMHVALYAFLLAMPVLGWLTLSAKGKAIPFFGLQLPALIGADKPLAGRIEDLHTTLATVGYWLVGLHALAALYHHYVVRDDTLLRMLPRAVRKRPAAIS